MSLGDSERMSPFNKILFPNNICFSKFQDFYPDKFVVKLNEQGRFNELKRPRIDGSMKYIISKSLFSGYTSVLSNAGRDSNSIYQIFEATTLPITPQCT